LALEEAWQNCFLAARTLATGNGSLRTRIGHAFVDHLSVINPQRDLPEDIRPKLAEIRRRLTRMQPHLKEGGVAANIAAMSYDEALRLAEDIFDLHSAVARCWPR
jgi:hypothetical protein